MFAKKAFTKCETLFNIFLGCTWRLPRLHRGHDWLVQPTEGPRSVPGGLNMHLEQVTQNSIPLCHCMAYSPLHPLPCSIYFFFF